MTEVNIPSAVTDIQGAAFGYCYNLTSITLPNVLKTIGDYTFSNCSGLTSVILPSSLEHLGSSAFISCINLSNITSLATVPPYLGNYGLVDYGQNLTIYVPSESVNDYKAANGWTNYSTKIQALPTS